MAGIQNVPLRIPDQWSPQWFETFVREVLSKLDTRNALGTGVTISSDGNSVASLATDVTQASVDADISSAVTTAITDHEAAANPHPTYLTQAEADALYEPTASILAVTTVGALPAAAAGNQGVRCMVTDANATTFLSTVAAGGANIVPVISDGANWKIG